MARPVLPAAGLPCEMPCLRRSHAAASAVECGLAGVFSGSGAVVVCLCVCEEDVCEERRVCEGA